MKITQFEKQKRDPTRFNIYLDGVFYCGLTMESIVSNRLAVGMEIDKTRIDEIQFESEKQTALNKAVKYVSKSMKTQKEVVKYLKGKGYTQGIIDFVLGKLGEYDIVNDSLYSDLYIKQSTLNKGKRRIEFELKNKGVDEKVIREKVSQIETDKQTAFQLAEKYLRSHKKDEKTREKLFRFLTYRGFSCDDTMTVLREILKGEDDYESGN